MSAPELLPGMRAAARLYVVGILGAIALVAGLAHHALRGAAPTDAALARADSVALRLATVYRAQRGQTDRAVARLETAIAAAAPASEAAARATARAHRAADGVRVTLAPALVRPVTPGDTVAMSTVQRSGDTTSYMVPRFFAAAYLVQVAALDSATRAITALRGVQTAAQAAARQWQRERAAADSAISALRDQVAALERARRCRIVGPIPCPSRTVVALLAGAAGALVVPRLKVPPW